MHKTLIIFIVSLFTFSLAGCATPPRKETVGGMTGAVVGGVVGHQIGKGRGKDLATAVGVIIGAMVGANIGRHLDEQDEMRAQQILEYNRDYQYSEWVNPNTQAEVSMTPTRTYQTDSGQYCREYQTEVIVGGKKEKAYGTACRQPDGSWKIVN